MLLERSPERLKESTAVNLTALCRISGNSTPYLKRLESILTLPETAIEAVRKGQLNKSQAQAFAEKVTSKAASLRIPFRSPFFWAIIVDHEVFHPQRRVTHLLRP